MHETALVGTLLNQVGRLLDEQGAEAAEEVRVEVGPLSGVEPLLVRSAFERLSPASSSRGARLVIDDVPLTARCDDCGREFEIEAFRFQCPLCGSRQVRVVRGEEFRLVSVSLRMPVGVPPSGGGQTG